MKWPGFCTFLYSELGIKSVEELERAAREHRLRRLPHFGETKEENIIKAIERYRQRSTRIPLGTALPLVRDIVDVLKKSQLFEKIEPAGSLRRRKESRKIYCDTDDEVYKKLGLLPIPPEIREDAGEIEAALEGKLPELVELEDIKGDFHTHTDWSEGTNTLPEMAEAARKRGYEYIAVTDHSRAIGITHGLNEERMLAQIKEIGKLNDKLSGFRIFTGTEVDIKADASLDLPDNILKQCDVVVGALHTGQRQTRREITGSAAGLKKGM